MQCRLDSIEKEQLKCCASKAASDSKLKENKKKHAEEVRDLQAQVTRLNKALKTKDKVDNDLHNARDTIKALKSEKSALKTSKTKLEGETRKLEKRLKIMESKNFFHVKAAGNDNHDINENVRKTKSETCETNAFTASDPVPAAHCQIYSTWSPSMVSHWNPHQLSQTPQNPGCIKSMIAHSYPLPPPKEDKLLSKEDFLELWAEHREQVRKDWAEIFLKITNLNIQL